MAFLFPSPTLKGRTEDRGPDSYHMQPPGKGVRDVTPVLQPEVRRAVTGWWIKGTFSEVIKCCPAW